MLTNRYSPPLTWNALRAFGVNLSLTEDEEREREKKTHTKIRDTEISIERKKREWNLYYNKYVTVT